MDPCRPIPVSNAISLTRRLSDLSGNIYHERRSALPSPRNYITPSPANLPGNLCLYFHAPIRYKSNLFKWVFIGGVVGKEKKRERKMFSGLNWAVSLWCSQLACHLRGPIPRLPAKRKNQFGKRMEIRQ